MPVSLIVFWSSKSRYSIFQDLFQEPSKSVHYTNIQIVQKDISEQRQFVPYLARCPEMWETCGELFLNETDPFFLHHVGF